MDEDDDSKTVKSDQLVDEGLHRLSIPLVSPRSGGKRPTSLFVNGDGSVRIPCYYPKSPSLSYPIVTTGTHGGFVGHRLRGEADDGFSTLSKGIKIMIGGSRNSSATPDGRPPAARKANLAKYDAVNAYAGHFRKKERQKAFSEIVSKTMDRKHFLTPFKGSDPRAATCRGKLQSKRSKLNVEINKQLMLRSGAENLFKATSNKKLRETVALELSFVNSNLQLLKEQLAELNSSVELYQNSSNEAEMPMIPLGLKETKEIDFREPFKDVILEHYSEDPDDYEDSVAEFMDVRQAMRTPTRDGHGIALLFEHFNQLYFVDRRFFPPHRSLGIYFEWYDSLTGVPSSQRTVAFEKASVLFNIGALYTQMAARQDRRKSTGLDAAVDNFLRSAGTFQYIHENFTNAPSMDLSPATLNMLVHLMCGQARECLFEKAVHSFSEDPTGREVEEFLVVGQEAAHVSEVCGKVHRIMSDPTIQDYVPLSWISLAHVKKEHYKALAHYYVAMGLLERKDSEFSQKAIEMMRFLHDAEEEDKMLTSMEIRVPTTSQEKKYLGKAHLREALLLHEEAMRVNRMCRELRKKDVLQELLRKTHDTSLNKYASIDEENDFQEVLDPPPIVPATKYQLSLTFPDFSQHKVGDLFSPLGPVAIFSAKHHWSVPRTVNFNKPQVEGFGFSVRGDAPVVIAGVDHRSLAEAGGMKEGDYVVAINEQDVKWSPHDQVVSLIKASGNSLKMKLVTPLDQSKDNKKQQHRTTVSSSPASSGVGVGPLSSSTSCSFSSGSMSGDSPTCSIRSTRSMGRSSNLKTPSSDGSNKKRDRESFAEVEGRMWNPLQGKKGNGVGTTFRDRNVTKSNELMSSKQHFLLDNVILR